MRKSLKTYNGFSIAKVRLIIFISFSTRPRLRHTEMPHDVCRHLKSNVDEVLLLS